MESSIAVFLKRRTASELPPTRSTCAGGQPRTEKGRRRHSARATVVQRQCKLLVALVEKPHSATSTAMCRGTSNCVAAPEMANLPG